MIDQDLIHECRQGNFSNFRKLAGLTIPLAFPLALRMLGDEALAEDVVQETLVTVWKKISTIKSAEAYKAWIRKIVVNNCYDLLRNQKRNKEIRLDDKTWQILSERIFDNPSDALENKEIADLISGLTDKLSPKQKIVFVLSEIEEMSAEEIVKVTGMSKTTIKANLFYARKSVSLMISKYI